MSSNPLATLSANLGLLSLEKRKQNPSKTKLKKLRAKVNKGLDTYCKKVDSTGDLVLNMAGLEVISS